MLNSIKDETDEARLLREHVAECKAILSRRAALKQRTAGSNEPFDAELVAISDRAAREAMAQFQKMAIVYNTTRLIKIRRHKDELRATANNALFHLVMALAELGVDLAADTPEEFSRKLSFEITQPHSALQVHFAGMNFGGHVAGREKRYSYMMSLEGGYAHSRGTLMKTAVETLLAMSDRKEGLS